MDKNIRELAEVAIIKALMRAGIMISAEKAKVIVEYLDKAGYIKPSPLQNSHLETEGELVERKKKKIKQLEKKLAEKNTRIKHWQEKFYTLSADGKIIEEIKGILIEYSMPHPYNEIAPTSYEVAKEILSKLSPHLARLEGENERLKKLNNDIYEDDQAAALKAVDLAVQAERDRIKAILYDIYDRKEIDIIFNTKE